MILFDCELYAHWKKINNLIVISQPEKNEYIVGENFDSDGMSFEVIYSDGTSTVIGPDTIIFSQNRFLRPGGKIITADYCGVTASFYVQVNDGVLTSLSVSALPAKTEYASGEELDTEGLTLTAVYDNGQSVSVNSGYEISCDLSSPGTKTVTVTYTLGGVTVSTSFEVTVTAPVPTAAARVFSDIIEAESGGSLSVPVYIENNEGFMGLNIGLSYDDSVLTPVSVSAGSMLSGGMFNDSVGYSEPGFVNVVYFGSGNVTENGTLFTVEFSVTGAGDCSTEIVLSYDEQDTFNESWDSVALECSEIAVNISASAVQTAVVISFGEAAFVDDGSVTVPAVADGENGVYTFGFEVDYDENVLSFVSSDLTPAPTGAGNGKTAFSVSNCRINGKTTLGELVFNVISTAGDTTLSFAGVTAVNQSGEPQTVSAQAKKISLEGISPATPTIYADSVYALPGDAIDLPIMLKNNNGLMGIAILVDYDPEQLTLSGVRRGEITASGSFDSNNTLNNGECKIIWYDNSQTEATGSLAVLSFVLSENADAPVPVNITVLPQDTFNENWEDVDITVGDIAVNLNRSYSVTFVSRGNVVSVREYTLGNPSVTVPAVPNVPGLLNGRWENFDLSNGGDITVNALYENPSVLLPARTTLSVNEKRAMAVSANFEAVTKEWRTSDSSIAVIGNNGRIIAMAEGKCTVTVTCVGTDELGNTIRATDTMRVTVKAAKTGLSIKEACRSSFEDFFRYTLHEIVENFVKIILRYLTPYYNKPTS